MITLSSVVAAVGAVIIGFTLMCLLFTYLEYLYYHKVYEQFKEYTFKEYVKERGIF